MDFNARPSKKIWIDTDAGTDDAIALLMALRHEHIKVEAISCIGGNVPLHCVVQNVLYICELCHQTTPVFVGAERPLQRVLGLADFIHGKDGLGDIGIDLTGREAHGKDAHIHLINTLLDQPGEITVVALGPLTNLAMAEQAHPNILQHAKEVIIMGGLIDLPGNVTPRAEFNIWADPEAANIVLSSKAKMTMLGWDTTLRSGYWSVAQYEGLRTKDGAITKFALDIQNIKMKWLADQGMEVQCNLPDPLAMTYCIDPSIVTASDYYKMSVGEGADDDTDRGYITAVEVDIEDKNAILFIHDIKIHRFLNMVETAIS